MKKRISTEKLKRACAAAAVAVLVITVGIACYYAGMQYRTFNDYANYEIFIYDDGRARIDVTNINYVTQQEDGTLIIPGDPQEYNYTRHDYHIK